MKKLLLITLLIIALTNCKEKSMNNELQPFDVQKEFADNGFTFFTKNLILCSGDTTENNAMTIGWGGIGNYLGSDRPVVNVYVAPARYTWQFMERHKRFTIMEFEDPEVWKYMGRNSGRDGDKAAALGLHTAYTPDGTPYYKEAKLVIECEIMTSWHQNASDFRNNTPKDWYADFDAGFTLYI